MTTTKPNTQEFDEIPIYTIRGLQVVLDSDLAVIYGVETRALNQAVKRNLKRFPEEFSFQIDHQEFRNLISQSVISSQHGGHRKATRVFTKHGALSGLL